jgi:hypothetical protein
MIRQYIGFVLLSRGNSLFFPLPLDLSFFLVPDKGMESGLKEKANF